MQNKTKKLALLLIFLIFQISAIAARNYWECETHPKVICQKSQTCCKKLINDPAHDKIITSYECFEGINQVCCGSRGVCAQDEYCNPILSKCEKIKLIIEKEKQVEGEELKNNNNEIKENKLNFLFDQNINTNLIINSTIKPEFIPNIENKELKKFESQFEKDYLPHIPLEKEDILSFNYNKILESIPFLIEEFNYLHWSWRNLTTFAGGFLKGLHIFESAYQNTTCAEDVKKVAEDWNNFFDFLNTIKYDKDFFKKLHEAVDRLEEIHQDYQKKRKDCVDTWHKLSCIMKRVFDRVLDPEFPRKLAGHTICNYHELKNMTNGACCALRHKEYYQAGFKFGDTYRFFMFWDYNSTMIKDADEYVLNGFHECGI